MNSTDAIKTDLARWWEALAGSPDAWLLEALEAAEDPGDMMKIAFVAGISAADRLRRELDDVRDKLIEHGDRAMELLPLEQRRGALLELELDKHQPKHLFIAKMRAINPRPTWRTVAKAWLNLQGTTCDAETVTSEIERMKRLARQYPS